MYRRFGSLMIATYLLSACGNPYAYRVDSINYRAAQSPGTIQLTDPKLYKRESLINERNEEVSYLNKLIQDSPNVSFSPEILAELQTVTTLSAALGLKFDPAAGLNYRRAKESGDIQQDIQTLKLQLQLDQLKRDAELMRAGLSSQTAPVNGDLGKAGEGGPSAATSGLSADAANQLTAAVAALQTTLQTANGAALTPLAKSSGSVNPSDLFQDRAAYRSLLNSAKNAVSLDELHDYDGSALIRLSFGATVLPPDKDHSDTMGLLRMQIERPDWTYEELVRLYGQWLDHVNRTLNTPVNPADRRSALRENAELLGLRAIGDLYDTAFYHYRYEDVGAATQPATCPGLDFQRSSMPGCSTLIVAVPRARLLIRDDQAPGQSLSDVITETTSNNYSRIFQAVAGDLAAAPTAPVVQNSRKECILDSKGPLAAKRYALGAGPSDISFTNAIAAALTTYWAARQISAIEVQARRQIEGSAPEGKVAVAGTNAITALLQANTGAGPLISLLLQKSDTLCPMSADTEITTYIPPRFMDVAMRPGRVSVYEVGPHERMQQMSVMGRASEAIGLAASIAGTVPGYGIGADGNIAYSRSATGRADALERMPLVVSFAEPATVNKTDGLPTTTLPAFGWVLGPRVDLDTAAKKLKLVQALRTYDLSVDLSVPGWWLSVRLKTSTAWAPNWRGGTGAVLEPGAFERTIAVSLSPNAADMDGLTSQLLGTSAVRNVSIIRMAPEAISACGTSRTLEIFGDSVWRASSVIVGGRKFDGPNLSVMPDMRGVLVTISDGTFPIPRHGPQKLPVSVLTPYGEASSELGLVDGNSEGACSSTAAPKPGDDSKQAAAQNPPAAAAKVKS